MFLPLSKFGLDPVANFSNTKARSPIAAKRDPYWHAWKTMLFGRIYKKLATIVEGDPKAPFSIDITPSCKEERYSFPWIAPLYFDPYLIMLSAKQGGIKYYFLSL